MTKTVLIDSVLHIKGIVASKWIFYSCISQHSAEAGGSKIFLTKSYAHHSAQKRSRPHDGPTDAMMEKNNILLEWCPWDVAVKVMWQYSRSIA